MPASSTLSRGSINRLLSIARYHRPQQLVHRALSRLRRKLLVASRGGRFNRVPDRLPNLALSHLVRCDLLARYSADIVQPQPELVDAGQLTLLNRTIDVGSPIDWRCSDVDVTHLWRFHLHYHEFLLGVAFGDDKVARLNSPQNPATARSNSTLQAHAGDTLAQQTFDDAEPIWRIVQHWIESNRLSSAEVHDDAWHPFCISRRLRVWYLLLQAMSDRLPDDADLLNSLFQQSEFLHAHLEYDLGGNHLLENLRALAFSAACLECDRQAAWRKTISKLVTRELAEQVLSSGEHFERSPHYHIEMLDVVCDFADTIQVWDSELSRQCRQIAVQMARHLRDILHPDGGPPLFSDGAYESPVRIVKLMQRATSAVDGPSEDKDHVSRRSASVKRAAAKQVGDYWTFRSDHNYLILDAGPLGPDHLPAHGHSDLLNFEASLDEQRFIVDSGTYEYGEGTKRDYVRSTRAHNCLEIDGLNQCDVWSRFRLGHRGHGRIQKTGETGDFHWAWAVHNAYRDLGVAEVHRLVACSPETWMVFDWFHSKSSHRLQNRLHFGPDVHVSAHPHGVKCEVAERSLRIESLNADETQLLPAEYFPDFGISQAINKFVASSHQSSDCWAGWLISLNDRESNCNVKLSKEKGLSVSFLDAESHFAWN